MAQRHISRKKRLLFFLATGTPLQIEDLSLREESLDNLLRRCERHDRALDRIARLMRRWS